MEPAEERVVSTRAGLDGWLAGTEWVNGDNSVSSDAMRHSPAQPDDMPAGAQAYVAAWWRHLEQDRALWAGSNP